MYNKKLVRDIVHTTEYGSKQYAKIIFREFNKLTINYPINTIENKYCKIKKLIVNRRFYDNVKIKGKDCEIISCYLKIGPNSGYINCNNKTILLWDSYCHYERICDKFNFNQVYTLGNNLNVKILNRKVDYSSCRRKFENKNIKFEINIISIYYIYFKFNINGL